MAAEIQDSRSARFALRCSNWAERWFPDSWVFAALAVVLVCIGALVMGAKPTDTAKAFGDGFWSLIPFTMQMAFVVIGGYVVASSPPAARLIDRLARIPKNGRSAVCWVALISMLASLLNWGLSLVFGGLLVRALARRTDLKMDYRAAGAAAYLGLGAVWALGLSSSAAQLQANPASLPPSILSITGVIPFTETIFLWQSGVLLAALVGAGLAVVGVVMQAMVRNPLADPYMLGVSSGASVGAVSVLAYGSLAMAGIYAMTAGAFVGALLATALVYALAQQQGRLHAT
ncbi:iron chelate uptake ABC transporter family permease subunit, partial [Pseudomonas sp.]|uniref:iron chelate uptake ABC transporter family permease subunit n=1 Tax=Pseudomonas sp. TaxID=306 RepID=UPI00289DA94F